MASIAIDWKFSKVVHGCWKMMIQQNNSILWKFIVLFHFTGNWGNIQFSFHHIEFYAIIWYNEISHKSWNTNDKLKHFDVFNFATLHHTSIWIQNACKKLRISHRQFFFFFCNLNTAIYRKILRNRINWDAWYPGIVLVGVPAAVKLPFLEAASQLHISRESCPHHHCEKYTLSLPETLATQVALQRAQSERVLTQTEQKVPNSQPSRKECPALPTAVLRETTADHSCGMNSGTPKGTAPFPHVVSLNCNISWQVESPARQIFHFTSYLPKDKHYYGARLYHQVQSQGGREVAASLRGKIPPGGTHGEAEQYFWKSTFTMKSLNLLKLCPFLSLYSVHPAGVRQGKPHDTTYLPLVYFKLLLTSQLRPGIPDVSIKLEEVSDFFFLFL